MLAAFVVHATINDVAAATGLSAATVKRWKRLPANWAAVELSRAELVGGSLHQLRNGLRVAADRLVRIAKNAKTADAIAVRASCAIFESFSRLEEHTDLARRIANLENALGGAQVIPLALRRPHE